MSKTTEELRAELEATYAAGQAAAEVAVKAEIAAWNECQAALYAKERDK